MRMNRIRQNVCAAAGWLLCGGGSFRRIYDQQFMTHVPVCGQMKGGKVWVGNTRRPALFRGRSEGGRCILMSGVHAVLLKQEKKRFAGRDLTSGTYFRGRIDGRRIFFYDCDKRKYICFMI